MDWVRGIRFGMLLFCVVCCVLCVFCCLLCVALSSHLTDVVILDRVGNLRQCLLVLLVGLVVADPLVLELVLDLGEAVLLGFLRGVRRQDGHLLDLYVLLAKGHSPPLLLGHLQVDLGFGKRIGGGGVLGGGGGGGGELGIHVVKVLIIMTVKSCLCKRRSFRKLVAIASFVF